MKRKLDWEHEEENSEESNDEEEEESEEEPIIQTVLKDLSTAVSHQDAKDLLHSMATSKDIVFWTPGGELLRNQQRIPVTSITELLDYVLLPYNRDILKPRALNSFLEGLAELGINKRWIRNKKALSDIMEKEDKLQNNDQSSDTSDDEEETDSDQQDSDDDESDSEQQEDEGDDDNDENKIEKDVCFHCGNDNVKVHRIIKCPKCLWHDRLNEFADSAACSICQYLFPVNKSTLKSVMTRCHACNTMHHRVPKRNKEESYELTSKDEREL